ncbi:MAG: helix-turn-helix domain-containing protein [Gorillibacterium sp.]|nr:helix-turn-helix domain-containing protein [Gorillibacterium sp.]
MRKKWFYRLLLSYFPVFFVMVSVLVLMSFLLLSEFSRRETISANEQYVRQLIQLVDHSLQEIDATLIKEIDTDEKLRLFFQEGGASSYYNTYEISKMMNRMVTSQDLIDSMYTYRYHDQMVVSANSLAFLDSFGDKAFATSRSAARSFYELSDARTYSEFQVPDTTVRPTVVSIVRRYPLLEGSQGLFVVNVSMDKINKLVMNLSGSNISFVQIQDKDGHVIAGPNQSGAKLPGTVLSKLDSDYTGWSFSGGVYDENLFRYASIFSYVWVIIGLVVVVVGAVWIAYVTKRNYRPIESIMNRITQYSNDKSEKLGKKAPDEFKFIEQALDSLIEQSNNYQKMHEEDSFFRRRHFLIELLEGSRQIRPEEWRTELLRHGLSPEFTTLGVAVYEIDKYGAMTAKYSERDLYLLKFVLNSVVKETAANQSISVSTEWTAAYQVAAIYHFPVELLEAEKLILQLADSVREWAEANLDFTVTVGVGEVTDQISGISHSYAGSLKALGYKTSLGLNRIITTQESEDNEEGTYRQLSQIPLLGRAFKAGEEEWLTLYRQIIGDSLASHASRENLVQLLNAIIRQIYKEIMDYPADIRELWKTETMPALNELRDTFDLAEELEEAFAQVLLKFAEQIKTAQESRSHSARIREVKGYIEREYANADLSLNHLCDVFGLNGKYLSRLFKEDFGEKLVDYMVRVRIEESIKLLEETSLSLQQIANEVGYIHDISYIRAFKKVIGTTPGDYRKQHTKGL